MVAEFPRVTEDPDTRWDDISLADARAWVDAAIELAAITFPPLETETWPACRALVEWITRGLPEGGTGYQRPQWDSAALARLADRFFASPYGARLDDPDHRGLLESLLWYGTDYGPGDPLRWSPVKVEILLDDWIPRKIVAPAEYLAKAPDLLRAFIRFAHAEVGLRSDLTDETLAAIDDWEPQYQQTIRSPRPQGPAALLAALGVDTEDMADMPVGPEESENFEQSMLDWLALDVGDRIRLDRLDNDPLPDEPFRWEGIPNDVTARVHEVLAFTDRCCEEMLDFEYRTACRRVLARVASKGPEVFRRKGRAETAAAALVWTVGKANDLFEQRPGGMQGQRSHEPFRAGAEQRRPACRHHAAGGRIPRRHLHCATRLARLSGVGSPPTDHQDARELPPAGRRDDMKPPALVQFERLPNHAKAFALHRSRELAGCLSGPASADGCATAERPP